MPDETNPLEMALRDLDALAAKPGVLNKRAQIKAQLDKITKLQERGMSITLIAQNMTQRGFDITPHYLANCLRALRGTPPKKQAGVVAPNRPAGNQVPARPVPPAPSSKPVSKPVDALDQLEATVQGGKEAVPGQPPEATKPGGPTQTESMMRVQTPKVDKKQFFNN